MGSRRAVSVADLPGVQPGDPVGLGGLALAQCGRSGAVLEARTGEAVWARSKVSAGSSWRAPPRADYRRGGLGSGIGILALCLIWHRLRTTTPPDHWNWPAAGKQAGELLRSRERLAQVLLALGLAVGAVTLATGALRSAVLAYLPQEATQFPALTPWLFGAGATVVLAAGYFPAYFALQRASRRHIPTGTDSPP